MSDPAPEIVIADIDKSRLETIRVALSTYEGTPTLSIWCCYRTPSGEVRHGEGGLAVGLRHLPALTEALGAALTAARCSVAASRLHRPPQRPGDSRNGHCAAQRVFETRSYSNARPTANPKGPSWLGLPISATGPMRASTRTGATTPPGGRSRSHRAPSRGYPHDGTEAQKRYQWPIRSPAN